MRSADPLTPEEIGSVLAEALDGDRSAERVLTESVLLPVLDAAVTRMLLGAWGRSKRAQRWKSSRVVSGEEEREERRSPSSPLPRRSILSCRSWRSACAPPRCRPPARSSRSPLRSEARSPTARAAKEERALRANPDRRPGASNSIPSLGAPTPALPPHLEGSVRGRPRLYALKMSVRGLSRLHSCTLRRPPSRAGGEHGSGGRWRSPRASRRSCGSSGGPLPRRPWPTISRPRGISRARRPPPPAGAPLRLRPSTGSSPCSPRARPSRAPPFGCSSCAGGEHDCYTPPSRTTAGAS